MATRSKLFDKRIKEIATVVDEIRIARGLSRSDIGKHLGVSHQQSSKYLKGTNKISAAMLEKLAEILDVDITDILESKPSNNPVKRLALEMNREFEKIKSPEMQKKLADLIREVAKL